MAKDPAFLFYPNDWIGGTMGMTFEEKGAYIELLMMQFNRGHMTEHMIGLTIGQTFGRIKDKFIQDSDGLWYNERLDIEKEKRKSYVQSRFNNKKGTNQYKKKEGHMSNHMEDVNVNKDIIVNNSEFEKKENEDMIVLEMMKVWNKYNPNYLTQDELDYSACLEMAYKIAKVKGWKKQTVLYEKQNDCVASWEKIVLFIRSDSFLKKLAVQNINNQFQMVIQKMTNPDEVKEVAKTERQNPTIKPVTEEMLAKYR